MHRFVDLSVYVVLDPDLCGGFAGMLETARAAAAGGATCIQLRAPDWKKRKLVDCGRAIKKALATFKTSFIINDHADVCLAVDADGLHIGQKDLTPADARLLIGQDRALGLSVSDAMQLSAVDTTLVDHLGIGPIYATATKKDAATVLGIEGFAALASVKPCPVVAIGSVKADMAPGLIAAGADGLAVVSAVCGQPDPQEATQLLAEAVKKARACL